MVHSRVANARNGGSPSAGASRRLAFATDRPLGRIKTISKDVSVILRGAPRERTFVIEVFVTQPVTR
jgi:hypothetical protein